MPDFEIVRAGLDKIAVRKDLRVPMRDGVTLMADAYQGVDERPRPELVALSLYCRADDAAATAPQPDVGRLHRGR